MSWIPYDTNGRIYLDFDVPITLKSFLKQDAVTLWAEIFPRIELDEQKKDHDELWIQPVWINLVDWQLRNQHLSYKYKRQLTAGPKNTDHRISLHHHQSMKIETDFPYIVSHLLIAEQFLYLHQSLVFNFDASWLRCIFIQ